jgi:hypothetical protein
VKKRRDSYSTGVPDLEEWRRRYMPSSLTKHPHPFPPPPHIPN